MLLGLSTGRAGPDPLAGPGGPVTVSGVTHDSRRVRPGDLYAALPGSQHHGAHFCDDAADAGAVAVLTDPDGKSLARHCGLPVFVVSDPRARLGEVASWIYGNPSSRLTLVGVTGTSGKTSTTYLLESGLRRAGHVTGLLGGVETRVAGTVAPSQLTTPEATDLQALLAEMVRRGVTAAAMEVSSHALALGRVAGTTYDVVVFTNLSQDHLDFHASMDEYFEVKASLFTPGFARIGVVNTDDEWGRELVRRAQIPVTTISAAGDPDADWRAADVRGGADGSTFRVVGPGGVEADASVTLPGPFNVSNALGAIVALVEAGVSLAAAVGGVAAAPGVPGRLERVECGQDFTVLVASVRHRGRSLADLAILTSDNPRSEDPLAILAEMLQGVLTVPPERRGRVIIEPDRAAAIGLAVGAAGKGDIVLVAGKGHERGQYAAGQVTPFDDREVAADALAEVLADRGGRDASRVRLGPARRDPGSGLPSPGGRAMEEDA